MSKPDKHPKPEEGQYRFEVYPPGTLSLDEVDLSAKVEDEDAYEEALEQLQRKAYALQVQLFLQKKRVVIGFEGWDAAGKGGAIKRLTALMDPRGYRVWPIAAPRDSEARHHYLWRFQQRLPEDGELGIFDRTWYGRVLVERVEGYCKKPEWKRAFDEINAFEHTLTEGGTAVLKFFLHLDKKTQLERFEAREKDPVKRFKIGPDDWRNRKKWKHYEKAIAEMLDRTHRPDAPWRLIAANDKRHARLEVLRQSVALFEKMT